MIAGVGTPFGVSAMFLSENSSENDINSYISTTIEDINNQAMGIYKNIESDLSIKIDDFSQEFKNINAEYAEINKSTNSDESEENSYISDEIKNKIGKTLKDKKVIEEGVKQILTKAKEWLPKDVMFGKGSAWIGKAAGKAAIVLSVAIEVYSMFNANKEHQQMIENERNRTLGAKNSAESLADNIQSSLFSSIDDMITDTFNNLIIGYKDASKKLSSDNNDLLKNKERLQDLSYRLKS